MTASSLAMAFWRASSKSQTSSDGARAAIRFSAFLIVACGGITGMSVHHKNTQGLPCGCTAKHWRLPAALDTCQILLHGPHSMAMASYSKHKSPSRGCSLGLGRVRPAHDCLCKCRLLRILMVAYHAPHVSGALSGSNKSAIHNRGG